MELKILLKNLIEKKLQTMVHFHVSLFNSKDFHEVHEKKLSLNQKHSQVLEKI